MEKFSAGRKARAGAKLWEMFNQVFPREFANQGMLEVHGQIAVRNAEAIETLGAATGRVQRPAAEGAALEAVPAGQQLDQPALLDRICSDSRAVTMKAGPHPTRAPSVDPATEVT